VYSVAKFYMANPFVYTAASCDELVIDRKYSALMAAACRPYSDVRCPFRGRKDCYKRRLSEVRFSPLNITSDALTSPQAAAGTRILRYCMSVSFPF